MSVAQTWLALETLKSSSNILGSRAESFAAEDFPVRCPIPDLDIVEAPQARNAMSSTTFTGLEKIQEYTQRSVHAVARGERGEN
jgi:hypothetical protein